MENFRGTKLRDTVLTAVLAIMDCGPEKSSEKSPEKPSDNIVNSTGLVDKNEGAEPEDTGGQMRIPCEMVQEEEGI